MTTEVNICNNALIELGSDSIVSLTEDSKAARQCNQVYDNERRKLLRAHPWNFAIGRRVLSRLTTTPAFEFSYEYSLPADCLRTLSLYGSNYRFTIEGSKLLTDDPSPRLIYIRNITDEYDFDPSFADLLSLSIAVRICYAMTGSNTLANQLFDKMRRAITQAKQFDGQEGNNYQLPEGEWLNNFIDV